MEQGRLVGLAPRARRAGAALVVLVAVAALPATAAGPKTRLASQANNGDPAADGTDGTAISGDGTVAAYVSDADNLPQGDGTVAQIYVRDFEAEKTRLVSRTSGGEAADESSSNDPWLSATGRLVAFRSTATNLPAGDGTNFQIYVHDRETGKTRLASMNSMGDAGDEGSSAPSLSGDGRHVSFRSGAGNLPEAGSIAYGVYVHDRETGKTRLASRAGDGTPVDADSGQISADGNHLVFVSTDVDLPQGNGSTSRVYVRDLDNDSVKLVSRTTAGEAADDNCQDEALSSDGSAAVFTCYAENMPGGDGMNSLVYVRDLVDGTTRLVSRNNDGDPAEDSAYDPFISGNGRAVSFYTNSNNLPGVDDMHDVYVYDTASRKVAVASRNTGGEAAEDDSEAYPPSLSRDGSYVVFRTGGDNLPGGDGVTQLYLRGPLN